MTRVFPKKWRAYYAKPYTVSFREQDSIKDLLIGRRIQVNGNQAVLDNGVMLFIEPNRGCGGCNAGWYDLNELNAVDNVITNVKFLCSNVDKSIDGHEFDNGYRYSIYVYAENKRMKFLEVEGEDGNGYYGTGYEIEVYIPKEVADAVENS